MRVTDWYYLFEDQLRQTDAIQWIVLITGVAEVLLARANHVALYAAGLVSSLLSIYSLYSVQLYAECVLGMYYVVMSIYGWWFWVKKKNRPVVQVTFTSRREWIVAIFIVLVSWAILYASLITFTSSNVPAWDSWVTATAWAGTWLLTRRKVENWLLLNVSNIFAIPLLMMKQLPLLAVLTLFLFIVACFGYFDWRKLAASRN
ncbi:nicotinamide riboside transporter PnuC [Chryseolinea sp. T2]|uniref:nicotinamide riboside transporter PnuC n=1 Tax=Chryseolinea sp. T2 TaxID=3129255 RepID=UPI003076D258